MVHLPVARPDDLLAVIFSLAKAKKRHLLPIFSYSYRLKNEGRLIDPGPSQITLVGELL